MAFRICYIDDEPGLLEAFSDLFSTKDVDIILFEDHALAIEEIKANPPDLIFIDYRLKGATGDKVILEMDPSIPKVLITGELNIGLNSDIFKAIFYKPFEIEEIEKFIQSQIEIHKTI